ncbi:MAG TPA: alkaline phosphatase D family protein [Polyangiaceae bacterium]
MRHIRHSRRRFIEVSALAGAAFAGGLGIAAPARARSFVSESKRPSAPWGIQIGDVSAERALVWSRADAAGRMVVEWSTDERFRRAHRVDGPLANSGTDFTARVNLAGLPADSEIHVRVAFSNSRTSHGRGEAVTGRFRTAPRGCRDVRFVWGGDTAGQGWGIDLSYGGMKLYETMRRTNSDFFIHSGDTIYADGPMVPEVLDASGSVIWKNAHLDAVPEKLKVAETLQEFRRNHLYNRYDEHVRNFSAEVPQIWQWDDHEVTNNWSASKVLDSRYTETDVNVLIANATRAFLEYSPIRWGRGDDFGRIYRHVPYGPDLDVFVLDMRSYRAANGCNVETAPGPETAFLGRTQLEWLKRKLAQSRATWKIIAADMPLGLIVGDGTDPASGCPRAENSSNGNGPVLGREFEIAELLRFIQRRCVANVVWVTADVHYCAAHYYDSSVARFTEFEPFWEFVAGPLHAGSFGPNKLDDTFGPTVIFEKAPPAGQSNLPPSAGLQFFGQADIDARSKTLRVCFKDTTGAELFSQELQAAR